MEVADDNKVDGGEIVISGIEVDKVKTQKKICEIETNKVEMQKKTAKSKK